MELPNGAEEILLEDSTSGGVAKDSVVLKLKNSGMVTLEMIYIINTDDSFEQVRESLARDAESIGAKITNVNSDSSEFSMESVLGADIITHHHLLFNQKDFVFDVNFFKNWNPADLVDIKKMMSNILLFDNAKEVESFITGQRIQLA